MGAVIMKYESDENISIVAKIKKKTRGRRKKRLREPKLNVYREPVPINAQDSDACHSIWQSVVVQAFYDLISESKALEQRMDKAEAIAWFGLGVSADEKKQTDFAMVCELAKLDPYAVMKLAREVIHGDKNEMRKKIISGFNFRTLRRETSSRTPKKGS